LVQRCKTCEQYMVGNEHIQSLIKKAHELLLRHQYDQVISVCREALGLDPRSSSAWFFLGSAEEDSGCITRAIRAFRRVCGLDPSPGHWSHLGHLLYEISQYEKAAVCFRLACEGEPTRGRYTMYGGCLEKIGFFDEAIEAFERAIECDPNFDEAYLNLGASLIDIDPVRARRALERALELDPSCPANYEWMSALAFSEGGFQESAAIARQGLTFDPASGICHLRLGMALEKLGDVAESEREFRKAVECDDGDPFKCLELAKFYRRQSRYEEAQREFEYVLHAWPDEQASYEAYIEFLEQCLGRREQAGNVRDQLKEVKRLFLRRSSQEGPH